MIKYTCEQFSAIEKEQIALLLHSASIVDTPKLCFETHHEVHEYLKVLELDIGNKPQDLMYIQKLIQQVCTYAHEFLDYEVPNIFMQIGIVDLLMLASKKSVAAELFPDVDVCAQLEYKRMACLLLKILHILFHVKARELKYRLPVSSSDLALLLSHKIQKFVKILNDESFPLLEYEGGEKSLSSILSKLLFKKETHAAEIHDRIRYRFIVKKNTDILPLLSRLMKDVFPYNYVVPSSCVNTIVDVHMGDSEIMSESGMNHFSSADYHVLNFVADVPIRVPDTVLTGEHRLKGLGATIFHLVEFQIFDLKSHQKNKKGQSAHSLYKERQKEQIKQRLQGQWVTS